MTMDDTVRTAHALDDATRPFPDVKPLSDFSTAQIVCAVAAIGLGVGAWALSGWHDSGFYSGVVIAICGVMVVARFLRGRREPVLWQVAAFVWRRLHRRHAYRPAQNVREQRRRRPFALAVLHAARRDDRLPWRYALAWLRYAWTCRPVGIARPSAAIIGDLTIEPSGVASCDDRLLAALALDSLILEGRTTQKKADLARGLSDLVGVLEPGQRLALIADNRSVDGRAVLDALREQQQPSHARLAEYVARRNRRWDRELIDSYAPDVRHYLVIEGAPVRGFSSVRDAGRREATRRDALTHALEAAEERLTAVGLSHKRLDGPALALLVRSAFHLTGEPKDAKPDPARRAAAETDAERAADVPLREGLDALTIGERYAASVYALRLPHQTRLDWLRHVIAPPFRSRLTVTFEGRDRLDERGRLEGKMTSYDAIQAEANGGQGARDVRMGAAEQEYAALIPRLERGETYIARASIIATTEAATRGQMDVQVARLMQAFRDAGCAVARGWGDQIPLFQRAALPLLLEPAPTRFGLDHRYRLTRETAGHCWTPQRNTPGHPDGMLIARTKEGRELVHYNFRAPATGVVLLAGVQGAGKSVLAQQLAMDTLCEDNWVTAVDPSGSWRNLCALVDGTYLPLADSACHLNLWQLARALDPSLVVPALVKAHRAMLSAGDADRPLSPFEAGLLHEGIRDVLAQVDAHIEAAEHERLLLAWLSEQTTRYAHRRTEIEDMVAKLQPFAGDGTYAHLIDSQDAPHGALDARMVVLDTNGLEAEGALLGYALIELVTTLRARLATARGIRARLFVDEGWNALKYALDWLSVRVARTARHLDQDAVLSTQNVSDVLRDRQAASILTAIPTIFLFRCVDEGATAEEGVGRFRRLFGLSQEAVEQVMGLRMAEEGAAPEALMVVRSRRQSDVQAAVVNVMPPRELVVLAGSYADERRAVAQAARDAGDLWEGVKTLVAEGERR